MPVNSAAECAPTNAIDETVLPLTADEVLAGGGAMGALMRTYDWTSSPLGPVASWPQSLRTAVSILLDSRYPTMVAWGRDYVQLYNDAYRPVLGATKHPAGLGQSTRDCFSEAWDYIGPLFDRVMAGGEPTYVDDQLFLLDRNGYLEETYFTFCYSAIRNETGRPGGVFVNCVETTNRVLNERRLRTLRELAAAATETKTAADACRRATESLATNAADVPFALIYLIDADGTRARLAGISGVEAGRPFSPQAVELADANDGEWPLARAVRGRETIVLDDLADRFAPLPSGPWPEPARTAAIVPVRRGGQETISAVLVTGVNTRRAFDDDYRGFLSLVAGQIGSAIDSARAYEEERRRAEALAEIDRAKTTFFSNVSHEFRTPLTLMLGPIEELLRRTEQPLAPADRDKVALLHRNALRLLKLVNTLLDFSRLEAGRVQAVYEAVDLAAFTAELASVFRSATERAGLTLDVQCAPVGEPVYVDRDMWEKIVLNLLSNAFKFTFDGGIRVGLERAGSVARLTVSDSGIGITPGELPHIFERFRRVEGARSRTHEGSGIGLALVQELVRLHGGRVSVDSTPGRGTTFTIDVPLGSAHLPPDHVDGTRSLASTALGAAPFVEEALRWLPDAENPSAPPSSVHRAADGADRREHDAATAATAATTAATATTARVLVVDDNADMRGYIARLLENEFEVATASDGADALERVARSRPDIVLSDVMMPRLNGFELVRAMREDESTRRIPIILLSARAGAEDTLEGIRAGADDYLIKPFAARELTARVRTHLELSRMREQLVREFEAERARLATLFERAPAISAVLTGPEHVFEMANPAYVELVGHRELIGRAVREVLPEIDGQGFFELLDRVYTTGEPFVGTEVRILLQTQPGAGLEERFLNFVYQPLTNTEGSVNGIFVHGVDVTAQVRARQEIERLYRRVQEANQTKSDFLAAMSHELRTPLNAIIGYVDLMAMGLRGDVSPSQRLDLERVRSASQYLLSLINDILNFTRLEAGSVEFQLEAVPLHVVLSAALELVGEQLALKQLRLEFAPPSVALNALADPERTLQVLLNLITNAVKFTAAHGSVTIWCDESAAEQGGAPMVRVHVRDTGVGIPPEQLTRIFEPFVQVHRERTMDSRHGVGLGLAISRDLARRMGGDIAVVSQPGVGSTFTISLPRATESDR